MLEFLTIVVFSVRSVEHPNGRKAPVKNLVPLCHNEDGDVGDTPFAKGEISITDGDEVSCMSEGDEPHSLTDVEEESSHGANGT